MPKLSRTVLLTSHKSLYINRHLKASPGIDWHPIKVSTMLQDVGGGHGETDELNNVPKTPIFQHVWVKFFMP